MALGTRQNHIDHLWSFSCIFAGSGCWTLVIKATLCQFSITFLLLTISSLLVNGDDARQSNPALTHGEWNDRNKCWWNRMSLEFSFSVCRKKKTNQLLYLILLSTTEDWVPSHPVVSTEKLVRGIRATTKKETISNNRKWLFNPLSRSLKSIWLETLLSRGLLSSSGY